MRIDIGRLGDDGRRVVEIEHHDGDPKMAEIVARIALPRVRELLATPTRGWTDIHDSDVPAELRRGVVASAEAPERDENADDRMEYVLREMAWALEDQTGGTGSLAGYVLEKGEYGIGPANADGSRPIEVEKRGKVDIPGVRRHMKRRRNGLRLFGKYMHLL